MTEEKETEEKIFEAARYVFERDGFSGARMQEIADEAGINKSMLHYYFRSKDKLFHSVFKTGVKKVLPALFQIINKDLTLYDKTVEVVRFYHDLFRRSPHLPMFVLHEMHQHPERFKEFIGEFRQKIPQTFLDQVNKAVQEGKLVPIKPHQFLINVLSLCMFPAIAKNMIVTIFDMSDDDYEAFMKEREEMIPDLIFKGLMFH